MYSNVFILFSVAFFSLCHQKYQKYGGSFDVNFIKRHSNFCDYFIFFIKMHINENANYLLIAFAKPNLESKISISIKMEEFLYAEISIYSCAGFLFYLFEDFLQRYSTEDRVRRFFSKMFEDFLQKQIESICNK